MTAVHSPAAATLATLKRALPTSDALIDEVAWALKGMSPILQVPDLPPPADLLALFEASPTAAEGEVIARRAGLLGGSALLAGLGSDADTQPEAVLRFLEAVVSASATRRGSPTMEFSEREEQAHEETSRPVFSDGTDILPATEWPQNEVDARREGKLARRGGVAPLRRGCVREPGAPYAVNPPEQDSPGSASVISMGVCEDMGGPALGPDRTLGVDSRYHIFVEIGRKLAAGALDLEPTPLPPLPSQTVLQIVLFGFQDGLQPIEGCEVGLMTLGDSGEAVVSRQPGGPPGGRRLSLPFATPHTTGTHRLRCNVYQQQTLLQSRLIEVVVTEQPGRTRVGALRSTVDFAAANDLNLDNLSQLMPKKLSLLINDNGNGTHGFRFFGAGNYLRDVTLGAHMIESLLVQARGELRRASWGEDREPTRQEFLRLRYRYSNPDPQILKEDLVALARRGYKLWDALVDRLSGGDWVGLRERMRLPGRVEIANKESLGLLVPAACLYDAPLAYENPDLTVCPDFLAALGSHPVAALPCFAGHCPSYLDENIVCPSGFWGFRHQIGHQASFTGGAPQDARNQSVLAGIRGSEPVFIVGISTDPGLTLRDGHISRLRAFAGPEWHIAESRSDLFTLFKAAEPTIVYLYGHGGGDKLSPFFEVGSEADGPILKPSLRTRASWDRTHPLVFLNGCHSAALSPDSAFDYAIGFLQVAHASAVVGTEIAVFESLAAAFAEECLQRFVVEGKHLGEAVLHARLALLDRGVPLGLAYLAFGPAEVHVGKV
ncbi:hypothetical protein [Ornithinimicrobium cerasi]|uniref:CHAT domain-containing protein n=1 Tax=Ornithinimicrobium cerasi TaxID=2248773 RepID=A0A285VB60_9MICO|nr:hypothetical protein [Ornithinimicrobium cerasi]SOC51207.1 hypothetical protein SAMN05421879_10178 [Ornithinimicrobium cerasi]